MKKQHLFFGGGVLVGLILLFVLHRHIKGKFDLSIFDSPDLKGSGKRMNKKLLSMLKKAEKYAGFKFIFSSGYRTFKHNKDVGGVPNSAHTKALAVDIKVSSIYQRDKVVAALVKSGFKRIGIGKTFVHADIDTSKTMNIAWGYPKGTAAPYNPFTRYSAVA